MEHYSTSVLSLKKNYHNNMTSPSSLFIKDKMIWSTKFYSSQIPVLHLKVSPYFVPYLNLHSPLLPFRIERNVTTGEYCIQSRSSQVKALIRSAHIIIVLYNILWILTAIRTYVNVRHDISTTFYVVSKCSTTLGMIGLQNIVWKKQKMMEEYIQLTSVYTSSQKPKILTVSVTLLVSLVSLSQGFLSGQTADDGIAILQFLRMLLSPICTFLNFHPLRLLYSVMEVDWLQKVVLFFFSFVYVINNTILTTMLILVLTFQKFLKEHFLVPLDKNFGNIAMILDQYKKAKEVADATKQLFGHYVLCFYIGVLAFFVELPHLLLNDSEMWTRLCMGFYMVLLCLGIGVAANANNQVDESLRKFLSFHHWNKNANPIERLQLIALAQEIDAQPIGISCSFFTVTKEFLSSTFGLFVTYSILIFQMSGKEKAFWEH